jgi:hypothetical protein
MEPLKWFCSIALSIYELALNKIRTYRHFIDDSGGGIEHRLITASEKNAPHGE